MAVKHTKYEDMYDSGVRADGTRTIRPNGSTDATAVNAGSTRNNVTQSTTEITQPEPTVTNGTYASGSSKKTYSGSSGYSYDPFTTSSRTNKYSNKLSYYEDDDNKPTWSSKYESTISSLLDGILNRQSFDINTDANYNQLYNNYAEQYQANARRSMNDALASANASTGGYGSTYGSAAAQQAYDQTMEGLNSQNINLMNLAYNMYSDDRANDYNKLNTVTGLDNTDYSRYRDEVGDYYTDRDYYANQYNNSYNNDYNAWYNDRSFDYGTYTNDRAYDTEMDQYEYSQYQDAVKQALSLAQSGLEVPDYIANVIDAYNSKKGLSGTSAANSLASIAQQMLSSSSSGGSRRGSGSSKGNENEVETSKTAAVWNPSNYYAYETGEGNQAVTNRNGTNKDGSMWVYIEGIGRVSEKELDSMNRNGKIRVIKNTDGSLTYVKNVNDYSGT